MTGKHDIWMMDEPGPEPHPDPVQAVQDAWEDAEIHTIYDGSGQAAGKAAKIAAGLLGAYAEADHAALKRAWECAGAWEEVAKRNLGRRNITGLDTVTLQACADMLRDRITDGAWLREQAAFPDRLQEILTPQQIALSLGTDTAMGRFLANMLADEDPRAVPAHGCDPQACRYPFGSHAATCHDPGSDDG